MTMFKEKRMNESAKFSVGTHITADTETTILTVPTGQTAILTLVYMTNHTGADKTASVWWEHEHDTAHDIYMVDTKPFATGDILNISDIEIVLKEGDKIKAQTQEGSDFSIILTFKLSDCYPLTFDYND